MGERTHTKDKLARSCAMCKIMDFCKTKKHQLFLQPHQQCIGNEVHQFSWTQQFYKVVTLALKRKQNQMCISSLKIVKVLSKPHPSKVCPDSPEKDWFAHIFVSIEIHF